MKKILAITILIFLGLSQLPACASGPLVVKGGMAITYGIRPFLYRYDKGKLGMFSNTEAAKIIGDLYGNWQAVKTSNIKFQQDSLGFLDFDVNAMNFDPILNSQELLGYTAVVFDDDGTLLDAFLGGGAGNSVLGLSGPITVNSGPLVNQIAESQAIFNGRFVNGIDTPSDPETSVDAFMGTIIHETGHGIGLDHSQINVEAIRPGASQEIRDAVPLEFPVAVNDLFIIRRDDASSVSLLYPNESELTKFGKIQGKVFRQDGITPALGANVIARNINNSKLEAISCVSDYLSQGTGFYTLFAVPPGSYKIEIEPIDLSFTGGSGVGPYTSSKTDKSFQNPVPKGFYTGPNLPITADINQALIVDIQAGQTIESANIIAAEKFVPTTSSSGAPVDVNEIEPNNTVNQAQVVALPVKIHGNAAASDDGEIVLTSDSGSMIKISDLYKFTLTQGASLTGLLSLGSDSPNNDLDLVLFNEDATEIIDTSSQTGNVNELISRSVQPGTYLLGIGAFSGSSPYTLEISTVASGGSPELTLTGPDALVLKPGGMNAATITAKASNFQVASKCQATTSDEMLLKIKPKHRHFTLSSNRTTKSIRMKVPPQAALDLINQETSMTVTISVTCDNGASDEFDLLISPTIDQIIKENRVWQIHNVDSK